MKVNRKHLYTALIAGTAIFFIVILVFSKKAEAGIPRYVEPKGSYATSEEWLNSKKEMDNCLEILKTKPNDSKTILKLIQAYINESRVTGNHGYYDKAALQLTDMILKKDPQNFEALCCKGTVLLSQHHFSEALEVTNQASKINPDNAFIYGLRCDANVELGNYEEAVKMADKMISIRPDIRSYSRVSYLREIYGDIPGAISAMKLAIAAGYPGLEQTEWSRMILGHLYESIGSLDSAERTYNLALLERPDYAFAYAGLGRIEKAKGNYKEAISYYEKADKLITEYSFADELTDLYFLTNQKDKSKTSAERVVEMLGPGSTDESVTGHGHYADKELAYAYLKTSDVDKAMEHAQTEYDRRPQNIDVCEAMAWVHYKRGEYAEANKMITVALKTGSQNPVLLCRAGLIKIKAGEKTIGETMVRKATALNPFLDPMLKKEAQPYLAAH
jgi:tetratricopeptide (TPR) repeat protein